MARGKYGSWSKDDTLEPSLRPQSAQGESTKNNRAREKWIKYRNATDPGRRNPNDPERRSAAQPDPTQIREDFSRMSTPYSPNDPNYGEQRLSVMLGTTMDAMKSGLTDKGSKEVDKVLAELSQKLIEENKRLDETRHYRTVLLERDLLREALACGERIKNSIKTTDQYFAEAKFTIEAKDKQLRETLIQWAYTRLEGIQACERVEDITPEFAQRSDNERSS